MESLKYPVCIDMEKDINGIAGVISSKIISNRNGEVEELHILSNISRNPKQISRDVQSLLITKFNLRVDHKKISVVQTQSIERLEASERFSIVAIGVCLVDQMVEVKVILKKGDENYEAAVTGVNTKNNTLRLVVQATLECVHRYLGRNGVFVVEDILKIQLAREEVVNIAITFISGTNEELLIGSAIKRDDYDAIVKATLDAINRKVVQITQC